MVSAFEATTVVTSTIAQLLAIGWQYHQAGDFRQAEQLYRYALNADPNDSQAHCCLGMLLASETRFEEAAASYRQALAINPEFAEVHNNLGRIFLRQGNVGDAVRHFKEAARLRPEHAEIHFNLGIALQRLDRLEEAVAHSRQALSIRPDYPEAHHVLAAALLKLNRLDEAIVHWREVIRLRPDFALAHNNLGCIHLRRGQPELALEYFQHAIRCQPDLDEAHANLLFCLNYLPQMDSASVFEEHCRWGQNQELKHRAERDAYRNQLASRDAGPERCLRIGYVSPDLRHHALVRYFEPVLSHHDPKHFEVFCYAEVQTPDAVTGRLQSLVKGWRSTCGLADHGIADRILSDRIDILVDLAGHTSNSRLLVFARKPAPVQITWLGYMNTTGLGMIDYRLTDAWLDPPGQPILDAEELFRLPGGMCCFAPPPEAPAVGSLPALGRGHLTFGSLNSLSKINNGVIDTWCELLRAKPSARLLMFRDTLREDAHERIRGQFLQRGISGERLDLRQSWEPSSFLKVYNEIDVMLDTFPCTGGVTTCESLWMGVPVLTLCGNRPASRNSAAILTRLGLSDWIVHSPEQYLAAAMRLTADLGRVAQLRCELRDLVRKHLCDAGGFTRALEKAYSTMWRRWCEK